MVKKKKQLIDTETYQKNLIQQAKGTMALGTLTTLGSYAFSRVGSNNPQVKPTTDMVVAGLNLTNVGNLANIGMNIVPMQDNDSIIKKKKKKKYNKKW